MTDDLVRGHVRIAVWAAITAVLALVVPVLVFVALTRGLPVRGIAAAGAVLFLTLFIVSAASAASHRRAAEDAEPLAGAETGLQLPTRQRS